MKCINKLNQELVNRNQIRKIAAFTDAFNSFQSSLIHCFTLYIDVFIYNTHNCKLCGQPVILQFKKEELVPS